MLFSYWITLFLPVFAFPLISHRHHAEIFAIERNGIAADNAGIRLGEGEVAWLNYLDEQNEKLKKWELAHHPVHACQLIPVIGAKCRAADQLWEGAIRIQHARVGLELQARWRRAHTAAALEIARVGGVGVSIQRLPFAPVRSSQCPVCRLSVSWVLVKPPPSVVSVLNNQLQTVNVMITPRQGQRYEYEFR